MLHKSAPRVPVEATESSRYPPEQPAAQKVGRKGWNFRPRADTSGENPKHAGAGSLLPRAPNCHHGAMVIQDPVVQAQANLKEAERQFKHAQEQFKGHEIPQTRLDELGRLRDLAAEDLHRTTKVFGTPIPDEERWSGNFRPA